MNETGEIPELGTEIKIDNFLFNIIEVSSTKIDLVTVQILEEE